MHRVSLFFCYVLSKAFFHTFQFHSYSNFVQQIVYKDLSHFKVDQIRPKKVVQNSQLHTLNKKARNKIAFYNNLLIELTRG